MGRKELVIIIISLILTVCGNAYANDPPDITSGTPPNAVAQGAAYNFTITATDPDTGDTLTYSISGNPAWMSINSSIGVISGTPGPEDVGVITGIAVTVTDAAGATDTVVFDVTVNNVNDPPEITSGKPPGTATTGITYSFALTATDPDIPNPGDTLTYSISGNPPWMTIDPTTGVISGTPDTVDIGTICGITVMVTDTAGATDTVTFDVTVSAQFTITPTADTGGAIDPSAAVTVNEGDTPTFTIIPDIDYMIQDVTVDGTSVVGSLVHVAGDIYEYTFPPVDASHAIHAVFMVKGDYTLTASVSGGGGMILPPTTVYVSSPNTHTFTIEPDNGFVVKEITVVNTDTGEPIEKGTLVRGTNTDRTSTYTTLPVAENQTIEVTFAAGDYVIEGIVKDASGGHIQDAGGTNVVYDSGFLAAVNKGEDATVTMVANSGAGLYIVEYAIDSGTPVPVSGSITEKDFIFTNITSHHRIETVFAKQFFSDDAEETETGIVITDANEIKLGTDTVCGFRFQNIPVPQGCPLVTASLEMQTPPSSAGSPFTDKTDAMNLTVYGEATDNALQFDSALESISDRLITSGFTYSLEAGEPQSDEIVLDVSPIVSEIVNRPGWNPGNAMAFIVEASGGYRYVVSIEGSPVYSEPRPALSIIYNCEPDPMEITTLAATDVAHNSAMLGGEIADTGGTNATKIGLYWSTSPAITQDTAEGKWEETGSFEAGDFSHNVAGLSPGTTYYVMACAENEQGSFCGNKESFTTGVITTTVSSTTTTVPPPSTTTTMMFVTTVEPSTTTIAPVTTTVAPVTTTVAPVTTTVAPVTTTIGSSTTTVAPVTTTIAPVTTTIATSTTTIESETTISTTSISTTTTTAPVITDRTTETVADGLWSDPAVWTAGMVPDANDVVQINPGHTVICDVASARVKGLLNYGTIRGVSSYPLTICTDPSDGFIHNKGDILGTDGTSSSQKWHTSKIIDDNGGNGTNIHLNGGAEFYNSGNIRAGSGAAGYLKGGDGGSLQIYAQHIIHTNGVVAAGNGGEGNAHQTEWDQVPDAHEYGNVNVFGGNGGSTLMKAQNVLTTTSPAHISSGQGGNAYVWCSSADCRLVYWTWEYDGRWWTGQCQCSGGKTVAGSAAGFGGDLILLASDLNVKSTASAGRGLYYEPETISTNSDTRIEAEEIFIFGGDNWTLNLNDLTEGAVSASGSITLAVGNNGVIDLTGSAKGAFKAGEQIKMLSDTLLLDDGVSPEELTDSGSEIVRGPSEILSRVFLFGPGQISGDIGTDTSVSLTLVNIGPEEDSYTLSVSDPSGSYTDALPASVTLEGLGYEELSLNLTLPSTPGDTDAFTVKVVSLKDPETVSETEISASANTFFVGSDNRGTAEDLRDAIRLMKILTGMREAVDSAEDVNGDGKIGIEEVISVLQMISAVKD